MANELLEESYSYSTLYRVIAFSHYKHWRIIATRLNSTDYQLNFTFFVHQEMKLDKLTILVQSLPPLT